MKKFLLVSFFTISVISAFAFDFKVNPQTSTPDFSVDNDVLVGWYIPLTITSDIFSGLLAEVEFSTGDTPMNKIIMSIGSKYQSSIDYGLSFVENGNAIIVRRHVKVGDKIGFYDMESWNKELLNRNKNYILRVEIDETRFRYTIFEKANENEKKYEYQFDGLSSSYLRERIVDSGLAIAVNKRNYFAQVLEVKDLGFGVGVKPIKPQTNIRYGYIKNTNSNFYLRRYGNINVGDYLIQRPYSVTANEIWKLTPNVQSDRKVNDYNVILENMFKNTFVNPYNCLDAENTQIYETYNSDCNEWRIQTVSKDIFSIRNIHSNGFVTVQNSSKESDAKIIQKNKLEAGSNWKFEDLSYSTPLETGYYTFKNLHSNYFMSVYQKVENGYVVQHSNDHSDAKVWFVEKQLEGTYTIKNIDVNQYLNVDGCSFSVGAYINVENKTGDACQKWIITKEGNGYTIKGFASGKPIGIRHDSVKEDEYVVFDNANMASFNWAIQPVDYKLEHSLGGVYKLKHVYTNLYMTVLHESVYQHAYIGAIEDANTNASWWTLEA